jgi:hypothetical protein
VVEKRFVFLVIIMVSSLIAYAVLLYRHTGLYGIYDIYGPFSTEPFSLLAFIILTVGICTVPLFRHKINGSVPLSLFIIGITIFILSKYLLPTFADSYYITSFYDSVGHLMYQAFPVILSGHVDPNTVPYFDVQFMFYITMDMLGQVTLGPIQSIDANYVSFALSWFGPFIAILLLPILYIFFKNYGINGSYRYLGVLGVYGIYYQNFFFQSEVWADAELWVMLSIIPLALKKSEWRWKVIFILLLATIIPTHEGVSVLAMTAVLSTFVYALMARVWLVGTSLRLSLIAIMIWFFYLLIQSQTALGAHQTIQSYANGVLDFVRSALTGNIASQFGAQISRPSPIYSTKILFETFFIGAVALLALAGYFVSISKKLQNVGLPMIMTLLSLVVVTPLALVFGGGNYVLRIPTITSPLLILGVLQLRNLRVRRNEATQCNIQSSVSPALTIILIVLIVSGTVIYFGGRNYQSTAAGDNPNLYASLHSPLYRPAFPYSLYIARQPIQSIYDLYFNVQNLGTTTTTYSDLSSFMNVYLEDTNNLTEVQYVLIYYQSNQDVVFSTNTAMVFYSNNHQVLLGNSSK